ncbi:MAG TPA: ATP-binding protein [Patescibacteria group bacterium]|jgi:predicted HTH transcriptional regulator|nr:ATP-binding protein [Patescibacteria group bacterium]
MDLSDFERLIEGSAESPSLEFKGPCPWSINMAKDILALSNVQDGGHIVIGIQDRTLVRVGVSQAQADSYDHEAMQDQLANLADPFVTFSVHNIVDADGKKFVVVRVQEFDEVPVVCRADSADTKQGVVYYRSRRGRAGSRPVRDSFDMRDILDRASVKLMAKRRGQGYVPESTEQDNAYDEELGGL